MSDNVIRPEQWVRNGEASLDAPTAAEAETTKLGGDGDGPQYPDMEPRVAALEVDMRAVRDSTVRIEATLATLATKTDMATLGGRVDTLEVRLGKVEQSVDKVERSVDKAVAIAVGKAIGPAQFVAIIASCAVLVVAAAGLVAWIVHTWFPH